MMRSARGAAQRGEGKSNAIRAKVAALWNTFFISYLPDNRKRRPATVALISHCRDVLALFPCRYFDQCDIFFPHQVVNRGHVSLGNLLPRGDLFFQPAMQLVEYRQFRTGWSTVSALQGG